MKIIINPLKCNVTKSYRYFYDINCSKSFWHLWRLDVMVDTSKTSTQDTATAGQSWVWSQSGPHSESQASENYSAGSAVDANEWMNESILKKVLIR